MPHAAEWLLEQFRLTVFLAEPVLEPEGLWFRVAEAEPDEKQARATKRDRVFTASMNREHDALHLRVTLGGSKVDWLIGPHRREEAEDQDLVVGSWADHLASCQQFVDAWSGSAETVASRLAIGAVLLQPVESRRQGYERLAAFLPSVEVDPESSDFFYRINRRRRSVVADTELNRLSEWSVAQLTQLAQQDQVLRALDARFFCRVGLDINTVPEFDGQLTPGIQGELLKELTSLAIEIASIGDVA